jgi:hypothetical protein
MPAASQQQQKLFGLALAVKRGEVSRSEASEDILDIVDSMSEKDIEDFASTKHAGLPTKVEAKLREMVREMMKETTIEEAELPTATIPANIKTKLLQAIDKIKDTNLNYNQKLQVIGKVVDSLGIDKAELSKISSKLKTTLESLNEKQLKGLEGISPNQTLDKISNADKLKIIKAPGNIIDFFVPDWAKGSRNFWQVIGTGKIKKNMSGEFGLERKGPMKSSPTFKTIDDLIDGVDWKSMEQTRRFNEGSNKPVDSLTENSLSDLEKKLKSHDWWYAYSDDNRKYKSGETNWFEITKMIKGMKGNKEAEKLWNKYSPKDFNYSFKELSETQLDEGIFKIGVKHIIPLIPTGYAPNDPKYKMDLKVLRNMLNNFYKERGYEKVILPSF